MANLILNGSTSGSVTLSSPAVSGTTTLTLPTTSGTVVVTSGAQTIEFADGSAGAPSITNSGDTNTGMFFPAADTIAFAEGGAESMRIDSSGNLLVGATAQQTGGNGRLSVAGGSGGVAATLTNNSNASAYTTEVYNYTTATGAGTGRYVKFAMGSTPTQTGSIIGDGTNTAFNTSSDYRLKENVEPMAGALALVMQQRPVTWVWKSNGKLGKGFIAHWLQEDGAGECVSGEKDAVDADGNPDYQGVDTSFLVATLTAAIQEQQAIIETLKSDISELKAKVNV